MSGRFEWDTTHTLVMGVLNVTPDSFSDGGKFLDVERAVEHGRQMIAAGADILDVGGESTRPGAPPVSAEEELRRVMPVVEALCGKRYAVSGRTPDAQRLTPKGFFVSVDTTKAVVAESAVAAGARIVNDISACRFDDRMAEVVRDAGAGLVLMHMQGTPATMQQQPRYDDVVAEVAGFLAERIRFVMAAGIERSQIAVDPGLGFGKTVEHNLALLANLDRLQELGCAVLVGPSRKSFIGKVLDRPGAGDRLWGTAATVAWAVTHGARIVRVHDAAEMVDVVRMCDALDAARTK